mmetsp:Transcript_6853/g.17120  ORF Transcript_6853/g.17120 Transcript_6853/m.17120 type:complete len:206 (-) Transcript_6853:659-1276(-)
MAMGDSGEVALAVPSCEGAADKKRFCTAPVAIGSMPSSTSRRALRSGPCESETSRTSCIFPAGSQCTAVPYTSGNLATDVVSEFGSAPKSVTSERVASAAHSGNHDLRRSRSSWLRRVLASIIAVRASSASFCPAAGRVASNVEAAISSTLMSPMLEDVSAMDENKRLRVGKLTDKSWELARATRCSSLSCSTRTCSASSSISAL